jgi:hypothetical protein
VKHALSALPEPYRSAFRTGRAPSLDDDTAWGYRAQAPSRDDPRRQPWRFFPLSTMTGYIEVILAVFLTPLSLGAAALMLRGTWSLVFEASARENLRGYIEQGRWGILGFTVVIGVVLLLLVGALLRYTASAYGKLWHAASNRRARKAGLGHYGVYLSHDHLLLRRADDARHALLVPREAVARIERFMVPLRGTRPTQVWRTELHVRDGDGLLAIAIDDHELEVDAEFQAEVRAWRERGLAPSAAAEAAR